MATSPGLAEEQRRALDRLSAAPSLSDFSLAGGTAIAIHCGHRHSLGLDLFSLRPDVDLEVTVQLIAAKFVSCEVVSRSDVTAQLLCDGARIDLVRYPYALIDHCRGKKRTSRLRALRIWGL